MSRRHLNNWVYAKHVMEDSPNHPWRSVVSVWIELGTSTSLQLKNQWEKGVRRFCLSMCCWTQCGPAQTLLGCSVRHRHQVTFSVCVCWAPFPYSVLNSPLACCFNFNHYSSFQLLLLKVIASLSPLTRILLSFIWIFLETSSAQ